jgi:hypothetical protein
MGREISDFFHYGQAEQKETKTKAHENEKTIFIRFS